MYRKAILEVLARSGRAGIDPRHVEAFMRLEHSTLDGLSRDRFREEVEVGAECAAADPVAAEELAESYGL
jgi:hypothetical protein